MSRAAIIGAIQRGLRRGALPADQQTMLRGRLASHPRHLIPARGQLEPQARVKLFMAHIEREFGTTERLAGLAEVPAAISAYLARHNLPATLIVSPHPALHAIPFGGQPLLAIRYGVASPTDPSCLTEAFAGIAETGTLLLPSGPERPTSNNLLPDNALVLIQAARITASYEDAFDLLRAEHPGTPRSIMLVTGPSRSADIEQTLELGAHGPRRLHVLIIDGEA